MAQQSRATNPYSAHELRPDLMLVDLQMPRGNGLEVARQLAGLPNSPRIIIMTVDAEEPYRLAAHQAGASGFLSKTELGNRVIPLLRSLMTDTGPNGDCASQVLPAEMVCSDGF